MRDLMLFSLSQQPRTQLVKSEKRNQPESLDIVASCLFCVHVLLQPATTFFFYRHVKNFNVLVSCLVEAQHSRLWQVEHIKITMKHIKQIF